MAKGGGTKGGIWQKINIKYSHLKCKGLSGVFQAFFAHFSWNQCLEMHEQFQKDKKTLIWNIKVFLGGFSGAFRLKRAFLNPPCRAPTLCHPARRSTRTWLLVARDCLFRMGGGAYLLGVGAFVLTVELSCLQPIQMLIRGTLPLKVNKLQLQLQKP